MDYNHIELALAPSEFFDEDARAERDPVAAAQERSLALLYAERAALYQRRVDEWFWRKRGRLPVQPFPSHEVALPGRVVTVVHDGNLDRLLLEIYVLHGWDGIRAVQRSLADASRHPLGRHQYPWGEVGSFFDFARNRLLLLVRAALIRIERMAAQDMFTQLSDTAAQIRNAWSDLGVRMSTTRRAGRTEGVNSDKPSRSLDSPVYDSSAVRASCHAPVKNAQFFTLAESPMLASLYGTMKTAVEARAKLHAMQELREKRSGELEDWRKYGDGSPPSGIEPDIAKLDASIPRQKAQVEDDEGRVFGLCKMAVLAIPFLKPGFSRADMDQAIGEVLMQFKGSADTLSRQLKLTTSASWVATVAPDLDAGRPLERLFPSDLCMEEAAVCRAMDLAPSDPAHLSLLDDRALATLLERGRIEKDSFEYVVVTHYRTRLMDAMEAEAENRARMDVAANLVAKAEAILSLAAVFTPAGRVAKIVSGVLGMGLLTYQAYSVIDQLRVLDLELAARLARLDSTNAEAVVYLGDLARMNPEYVAQLTDAAVGEILIMLSAGAGPVFKQMVHLRGYYMDLQTLVGE